LDEPTALLDRKDSARILTLIERLRDEGVGVAFVSHRLDEALRVADCTTVLRDGKLVASLDRERATPELLVQKIVGQKGLGASRGGLRPRGARRARSRLPAVGGLEREPRVARGGLHRRLRPSVARRIACAPVRGGDGDPRAVAARAGPDAVRWKPAEGADREV